MSDAVNLAVNAVDVADAVDMADTRDMGARDAVDAVDVAISCVSQSLALSLSRSHITY